MNNTPNWDEKPEDMEVWIEDLEGRHEPGWHKTVTLVGGREVWWDEYGLFWGKDSHGLLVHYPPENHWSEADSTQLPPPVNTPNPTATKRVNGSGSGAMSWHMTRAGR